MVHRSHILGTALLHLCKGVSGLFYQLHFQKHFVTGMNEGEQPVYGPGNSTRLTGVCLGIPKALRITPRELIQPALGPDCTCREGLHVAVVYFRPCGRRWGLWRRVEAGGGPEVPGNRGAMMTREDLAPEPATQGRHGPSSAGLPPPPRGSSASAEATLELAFAYPHRLCGG